MYRHTIFRVALILLTVLSILSQRSTPGNASPPYQSSTDWPMYQHDPAHSGRTPATINNGSPLYLQWAYAFGERVEVEAQPIIVSGVAYLGAMNGEMHAIDANTGAARWIKRPGGPIPHTAAFYNGRVYFGSLDGKVYALAATNGNVDWTFVTGGPVMSAPVVVDGRLYIGSNDGRLYAINAATGQELWHVETGGPVVSSPAVAGGYVYFGSEDLTARCVNAASGALRWATPLHGAGMHNTHPVVSDNGNVVIFVTVKPGAGSYVPSEGYPNVSSTANPVETWNAYYQAFPTRRSLYYLATGDGHDLWDASNRRYVPMPIPYWGLLHPILASDGSAWFPAPAGTAGYEHELDHDNRLFRIDLASGITTQQAGGTMAEFQLRPDEVGRHVFAGSDYYYTISEDLGVFRPANGTMRALFSNGDPSGYNFGSHMDPLSPLPSLHLWRYGGAVAMGGVPGASPPIVANGMVYYASYGWLYAVGTTNRGLNPATSFPARDARLYELTYPRTESPTYAEVRSEVSRRVADIVALGPGNLPPTARWEQAGFSMLHNEYTFELYGSEFEVVRVLSEAYPYLPAAQQAQLKSYLSSLVAGTLLNPQTYAYRTRCIRFGETGMLVGDACGNTTGIISKWLDNNPNLVGQRLYALWAYANATGDWNAIANNWSLITAQFQGFLDAYDPNLDFAGLSLGYCNYEEWRVGRLNIGAQIAAAQAVRDMADHLGYASMKSQASTLLKNLLDSRVALAEFVPHMYDVGARQPADLGLNPDGTIRNADIMIGPYNRDILPYSAARRDRNTDPSQVNWWDGNTYRVDGGIDFMHYPALSGYFPMSSELAARLREDLLEKTRYYVKTYEVNNPWWWMTDLAHHTTGSGEHLYHSPTLAWTMFQVKAWVLQEDWDTLVRELPEPVSFNSRYDLYRLQNLVTLLSLVPQMAKTVDKAVADQGDTLVYTISLVGTGSAATISDPIPTGTSLIPNSAQVDPQVGSVSANTARVYWSGTLADGISLELVFRVSVSSGEPGTIVNVADVNNGQAAHKLTAETLVNQFQSYVPIALKVW
jgi:uncharacterized repeat protein (TIGR01451 family)